MSEIIIVDLPKDCWAQGYPIHQGNNEDSLNYATLYANQNKIIPDQAQLQKDHQNFIKLLKQAGFKLHLLPFPEELNQPNNLYHDAVFVRDAGFMFKDYWIKANFSADRQLEADVHAKNISRKFNKKIIELPKDAYLEFGETFYLPTTKGTYYFGGLSRSNQQGHDFVREIIKPDHYCLIKSSGYHLDTVFTPVLSPDNQLIAFIINPQRISAESLKELRQFNLEIINVDLIDSSGDVGSLGNYAINTLVAPGKMLNCTEFTTPRIEERLKELKIERYTSPLKYFRYAGGSYHCLTNEIY